MNTTTLSHLERIAAHAPARTAAVANGRIVGYAALAAEIAETADRLRRLRLPPGRTVAVGCASLYRQLLVVTALEAMGIAFASFRPDEGAGCEALLDAADAAVCDEAPPDLRPRLAARFREGRIGDLSAWTRPAASDAPTATDRVAVIRSSGTTGRPKRMPLTRAMFDARCTNRVEAHRLSSDTCCFAAMHLAVHTVHAGIAATWRLGGCAMMEDRMPLPDALAIYRPTHVWLLTRHAEALLAELPRGFARIDRLTLVNVGARLTPALRSAALARLAGGIVDHYGANEVGVICALEPDGTGSLVPGLSARIVDAAGAELPAGAPGRLQLAGPAVASGYLDDPEACARCFRGGWFEPGDEAALLADGRLRLIGREDDVLNLGGLKLAAADVEAGVRALPGVEDAAATEIAGALAIAAVVASGADAGATLAAIRAQQPGARVVQAPRVPRTPSGKVRRGELRALLASIG